MRSPSPDNDLEDQLDSSDPEMNSTAAVKSPVRTPAMAAMASGRAATSRAGQRQQHSRAEPNRQQSSSGIGQSQQHARAEPSKHQSSGSSSPPAAVSTAPVPVNQLSNAAMPAPAGMTQSSPAQSSVSLDPPVQNSQPAAQDNWAAPSAAQATRHAVEPVQRLESRHDAAQQTVTAADTTTPVKAQELLTDDQSTQTPRAHASPRRLTRAPPGRDPLWPLASQAGLWEGLPPREGANVSPSGMDFASADMPGAFAPLSPEVQHQGSDSTQDARQNSGISYEKLHAHEQQSEQLLRHWQLNSQRQMASQQHQSRPSGLMPMLGQLPQQLQDSGHVHEQLPQQLHWQTPATAELPQQLQGQMPASEQLPRQLSSQSLSERPQLSAHQGHDQSDPFPASLLPSSSLPAHSRAAHTVPTAAESVPSQAAVATAVSDTAAAAAPPLRAAQGHNNAAAPVQSMSSNFAAAAAAAIAVTQPQQTAGSDAHPSAAFFARPPLPLHGPHLAMGEPYYHAPSHAASSGSLPQGYGRPPHGYGRPPAVPSGSWSAAAQEGQEWLSGGGWPPHVMSRHPPIGPSFSQMQRLRDTGATAVPCLCLEQLWAFTIKQYFGGIVGMLFYVLRRYIMIYCWRQVQCMLVPLPGLEAANCSACNLMCIFFLLHVKCNDNVA